jgi:hypothetical protein
MSQEIERRTRGALSQRPEPRSEPSWPTVAANTLRLWLERHHLVKQRSPGRRRFLVLLSALAAMAVGAGLTFALTGTNQQASPGARPSDPAQLTALQLAEANRLAAAKWVATQVSASEIVSCDPEMCREVQQQRFPAGQLMLLPPTAPDPLGSEVVIATPAIQSQFGDRLATVYAPEVLASFGSGSEQVVVRSMAPDGAAAYNAQLAKDRQDRIGAGRLLLKNSNIHANAATRAELLAGQVDPRLLATIAQLAHGIALNLVAFGHKSPGEGNAVPLRGAEISATSAGLSAILQILDAQQGNFAPAGKGLISIPGGRAVAFWYGAPGPLDITGL